MKSFLPIFLALAVSLVITGCYESKTAPKYPIEGAIDMRQPAAPSVNSAVKHYICSNNCEGSGGPAAGTCPVCGNAYVHNDAYHNNGGATTPTTAPSPVPGTTPTATPTPEPAQNAAGVWHYTCGNGCAGGAGAAGSCSKCGGALAHNAAYHN